MRNHRGHNSSVYDREFLKLASNRVDFNTLTIREPNEMFENEYSSHSKISSARNSNKEVTINETMSQNIVRGAGGVA